MKNKDSVELIEYTKAQDALNCITHALGAVLGAAVLVLLIKKAAPFNSARYMASAVVYGFSLILPVSSIIRLYRFCSPALRPRARLSLYIITTNFAAPPCSCSAGGA